MDSCRRGWHPPSARGMPSMHGGDGGHPMQSSFALDEAGSGGAVSSSMQHNRLVRVSCAMSSAVTAVAMERRRRAAASTMEGGSERASVSVVLSGQGSCSNTVNMQLLIRIGAAMRPRLFPVGLWPLRQEQLSVQHDAARSRTSCCRIGLESEHIQRVSNYPEERKSSWTLSENHGTRTSGECDWACLGRTKPLSPQRVLAPRDQIVRGARQSNPVDSVVQPQAWVLPRSMKRSTAAGILSVAFLRRRAVPIGRRPCPRRGRPRPRTCVGRHRRPA